MPIDPLSLTDSALELMALGRSALGLGASRVASRATPATPATPAPAAGQVIRVEPRPAAAQPAAPRIRFPMELVRSFRPLKLIGLGGMGAVFLVEDPQLGRKVAIKVVQDNKDPVHRERFLREAATLAKLKHANLPTVYSYGTTREGPYMVLEYVQGASLLRIAPPFEPLPAMLQVADALDEIHRAGFVHRDVKPDNILLTDTGRAVLVDFGLMLDPHQTPLTRVGRVVGTLNYVAPEVLAFKKATPASDWYAWGVTLYSILERVHPFPIETLVACARRGRALKPKFRVIHPDSPLAALLTRLLDLDPAARPLGRAAIEAILLPREAA